LIKDLFLAKFILILSNFVNYFKQFILPPLPLSTTVKLSMTT